YVPQAGTQYAPTIRPGFVPATPPPRPGYVGARPAYGPVPVGVQSMTASGPEVEKLTTLFIGGISPGVTDDWMEKVLKGGTSQTCGALKSWKRVKDQSGNPKGFGFAEYLDADSVLRALRVLGGEGAGDDKKDKGVVLPALEEGAVGKKLIVRADENTRKYLDQYEASRPRTHDSELDKNALLAVIKVVEDMSKPHDSRSSSATSPHDKARAEQAKERSHGRENRDRQYGHYHHPPVNFVPARESRRDSYILDDEEEEQKRQAKRKTEMEMAFKERERRWQHREETMAINRERDLEREVDAREKQIRDRELMARKLAEWDDDVEAERGQEEYYRDRSRWWSHRQQVRAREMAVDEQDRIREQQEFEAEQRRIEWERALEEEKRLRAEAMEAELSEEKDLLTHSANGSFSSNNIKAKLTLNISSKQYSDNEDDEKKTEDRKKKIKDLVDIIPSDREGLWKWNVKWEELDETIIDKKLRPFVNKKIVGYLGVQEDELVSFVMDHLRHNKSAEQLTKEMEMTLDEESELF
ncbi:4098_t:CDS:10, partial [Acaulospora morrowiae]